MPCSHTSRNFWKTSLYACEGMRVEKTNNILVVLGKYLGPGGPLIGTLGSPTPHFENHWLKTWNFNQMFKEALTHLQWFKNLWTRGCLRVNSRYLLMIRWGRRHPFLLLGEPCLDFCLLLRPAWKKEQETRLSACIPHGYSSCSRRNMRWNATENLAFSSRAAQQWTRPRAAAAFLRSQAEGCVSMKPTWRAA